MSGGLPNTTPGFAYGCTCLRAPLWEISRACFNFGFPRYHPPGTSGVGQQRYGKTGERVMAKKTATWVSQSQRRIKTKNGGAKRVVVKGHIVKPRKPK